MDSKSNEDEEGRVRVRVGERRRGSGLRGTELAYRAECTRDS